LRSPLQFFSLVTLMSHQKKIVLVTGVTARGLGAAVAFKLAAQPHYRVYGSLRSLSKASDFHAEEKERGLAENTVHIVELDVTNDASCAKAVKTIVDKEGRLDVLVNNAGAGFVQTIEFATMAKVHEVFEVNFFGVYRMMQAVLPHMRQQNFGRIVNVSSVGGIVGQPFNEAYCAAKAAVDSLGESSNTILRSFNIRVSTFCPGGISTNFFGQVMEKFDNANIGEPYKGIWTAYETRTKALFTSPEAKALIQTPDECADDIVTIVNTENPVCRYVTKTVQGLVAAKFGDQTGETSIGVVTPKL